MPSDEAFNEQVEGLKAKGNESFGAGKLIEAISSYSQGIVLCDRQIKPSPLKPTLLSNRAACYLKLGQFENCVADCTSAIDFEGTSLETSLRCKLLYRRSKARVALDQIQDAAQDCLSILQADANHKEAQQLLAMLRTKHKTASTPVLKTMQKLNDGGSEDHELRILLGLLDQDLSGTASELARTNSLETLMKLAESSSPKTASLALQVIRNVAGHPLVLRSHIVNMQEGLLAIMKREDSGDDVVVSCLAVLVRLILHADRDPIDVEISGATKLKYSVILESLINGLTKHSTSHSVIRAVLDVTSTWMAGTDRDSAIRAALAADSATDAAVEAPKSAAEIRNFTPQQLAAYKKREYEKKLRDQAWAYERARLFWSDGGLKVLLKVACSIDDATIRRECIVAVGRILACIENEEEIKNLAKPHLESDQKRDTIIEEVFDEDEKEPEEEVTSLLTMMERALISAALLLSKKDVGVWAMNHGWTDSDEDLKILIKSNNYPAMGMASELLSAASTVESVRGSISSLNLEPLLLCDDRDIRSGAASALAKMGLSEKATKDEGEMMGLLQAACDLLDDPSKTGENKQEEAKFSHKSDGIGSVATSALERAIEMITYLIPNTIVKEELAAGFSGTGHRSAIEKLVDAADLPGAGESLSGYGLATIFQNISATSEQIRKEAFEGKEVTMEQYDEMQRMGKTEEEKELMDKEKDPDTTELCHERIRQIAAANVPRALIALVDGASEHTLEQAVMAMNRMADVQSVRGVLIQQGVLSACIKIEKKETPTDTDVMKKVIRLARHTIGKMLVSTNPSLLTSAQRLGSIKPLIQLIRDIKASDLQHFEALMALTNVASSGEDAKNRIVTERGIPCLHFAMFSDHEMVRRAATEAMCNLVPHKAMMDHLADTDNLKLWLAFAVDYEENYECARAAAGCLAMASQDEIIAEEFVKLENFRKHTTTLLESGRLEIMHRTFALVHSLVLHGGAIKEKIITEGFVEFCKAYIELQQHTGGDLDFSEQEKQLLPITVDLATQIVKS